MLESGHLSIINGQKVTDPNVSIIQRFHCMLESVHLSIMDKNDWSQCVHYSEVPLYVGKCTPLYNGQK